MNSLEKLKSSNTDIVADTGDIDLIMKYNPLDVTTNPSLILSVCKDDRFQKYINTNDLEETLVNFGVNISQKIRGYISTEINPNYSFDTKKTIELSEKIINLYEKKGVSRERVLIKIAATWQGIKAAEILEKKGIKCNLTLIFSLVQALACAQANVTLISPFVGRITDWYKNKGHIISNINEDYGIKSVEEIYNYFKSNNYKTIIMAASFRNINQIKYLVGLDKLTISPKLLEELKNDFDTNFICKEKGLDLENHYRTEVITQEIFETEFNRNEMAKFKLKEGIEKFIKDTDELIMM
tara:strand:- start:214 stop:1104 length:891 start_codon:yes stop_codon:yes gene_type:complete